MIQNCLLLPGIYLLAAIVYCKRFGKIYTFTRFYRATVCIARTMPWQDVCPSVWLSVCLSVCLSVTLRYSVHTGIEPRLADHRSQAARTVTLPIAPPGQARYIRLCTRVYTVLVQYIASCLEHFISYCTCNKFSDKKLRDSTIYLRMIRPNGTSLTTMNVSSWAIHYHMIHRYAGN